jgi:hypothetical protein
MVKKMLIVFFLLLQVSVINIWGFVEDTDSIPSGPARRFIFPQAANNNEFPTLELLQTALAGYQMLIEEHSVSRPEVITIIDFSLPSDKERLWVPDPRKGSISLSCFSWP